VTEDIKFEAGQRWKIVEEEEGWDIDYYGPKGLIGKEVEITHVDMTGAGYYDCPMREQEGCFLSNEASKSHLELVYDPRTEGIAVREDTPELGVKYDQDKLDWNLLPIEAVEGTLRVMMYGAKKYSPENWKYVDRDRYYAAALRHLTAWKKGEKLDPETGESHLDHALSCLMFMSCKEKQENE
jgi:hypothetical protein